jgi:hypothetical protein
MEAKMRMARTPRTMRRVPWRSRRPMGVPMSHLAKRKLKMREDAPRGATNSERRYWRARVLPITWERTSREGEEKKRTRKVGKEDQEEKNRRGRVGVKVR